MSFGFGPHDLDCPCERCSARRLPRRCDCESSYCQVAHPIAGCKNVAMVKTLYSTICEACAQYMPAEYLVRE